ncbi:MULTISPECIES: hypothetical protein [unclassified Novosphingobium]|uniref:hypothetical protein n=1 Tax=unclassified Novosphingobium TaxID=2644732 RepID=UPI000D32743A|nr:MULTISPECIES: hypothetical protein [unclassified Novosphingobium]PTR07713.1 hypothetical protein C8K11_11450 [Novosphingobium sp. GV055]PUB00399.1 hypothetical protein C8K12_11450 [Novosphingobium sp. GV061]PUB15738.1 hypothetical protein C8K14_11450 [Novosphingobium sp. GV079]PUB39425.1 hypothetical protein C8K10_11450 [Novosphingobium sp. GV027]
MSVAGTWNIIVNSPMGPMKSVTTFTVSGDSLTGTATDADGAPHPIQDGKITGDKVSWKIDITNPMPLSLTFDGTVAETSLSGSVSAGPFGAFSFTGERG